MIIELLLSFFQRKWPDGPGGVDRVSSIDALGSNPVPSLLQIQLCSLPMYPQMLYCLAQRLTSDIIEDQGWFKKNNPTDWMQLF